MKASDLRIGNWVEDENGYYQIEAEHLDDDTFPILQTWEIPLTEEWLEKFGFDHHYDLGKRKFMNIKTLTIETNSSENFPVYYTTQKIIICYIKYVHQLQNLYFALTGEELILNA